jgi:hypothetical protein
MSSNIGYVKYDEVRLDINHVTFRGGRLWLNLDYRTREGEAITIDEHASVTLFGVDGQVVFWRKRTSAQREELTAADGGIMYITQDLTIEVDKQ